MLLSKIVLKRPIILFIFLSIVIIGLLAFNLDKINKLVLNIQLNNLKNINQKMLKNYWILQGLLLAKTWEDKLALYKDKKVIKYMGPNGANTKLFFEAEQIGKKYNINLKARFALLTYLYKQKEDDPVMGFKEDDAVMGFIGFDFAGINIDRLNLRP